MVSGSIIHCRCQIPFVIVYMDTLNSVIVETETPWDQEYWSCRDRDSLRPGILELSRLRLAETRNFGVVETETSWDWAKVVIPLKGGWQPPHPNQPPERATDFCHFFDTFFQFFHFVSGNFLTLWVSWGVFWEYRVSFSTPGSTGAVVSHGCHSWSLIRRPLGPPDPVGPPH